MLVADDEAARQHQRQAAGHGQFLGFVIPWSAGADDVLRPPAVSRGNDVVRDTAAQAVCHLARERGGERFGMNRRLRHAA